MSKVKKTSILLFRLSLAFIAMLVAYILGTMVIGEANIILTPEETSQAGRALIFVSLINALVLSYPILRSHWYGLKLVGAAILVQFGVETFMAQIETLYFNSAVQIGTAEFVGIVAAGALRALIFAPLAVFIFGKMKKSVQSEEKRIAAVPSGWGKRFAALAVFYIVVYFMFGYFVAWQWEETRLYYSGTTAIKPFFTHFRDLFLTEDPIIIPFQLLRGALWTSLAIAIVGMMKAKRWEVSLAVALTFAVLLSLPLGLFPNPYMPAMVARSHFFEVSSSMLLFGGIAGWVMHNKEG
ncbi:MAG: hypothetical protein NWE85_03315 [Candidatus Bathyarchaeota archaeon]|nr:hypothetical protein [Candidatus Bathyarchaeota archaeon]